MRSCCLGVNGVALARNFASSSSSSAVSIFFLDLDFFYRPLASSLAGEAFSLLSALVSVSASSVGCTILPVELSAALTALSTRLLEELSTFETANLSVVAGCMLATNFLKLSHS